MKKKSNKSFKIAVIGLIGMLVITLLFCVLLILALFGVRFESDKGLFASLFVSSLGSVITVAALLITIESNQKTYDLEIDKENFRFKEIKNKIKNTLLLENLKIHNEQVPKEIIFHNIHYTGKGNKKIWIQLQFSVDELCKIQSINLKRFYMIAMNKEVCNNGRLICSKEDNVEMTIKALDDGKFALDVVTNIDNDVFHRFIKCFNGAQPFPIEVKLTMDIKLDSEDNQKIEDVVITKQVLKFVEQKDSKYFFIPMSTENEKVA